MMRVHLVHHSSPRSYCADHLIGAEYDELQAWFAITLIMLSYPSARDHDATGAFLAAKL